MRTRLSIGEFSAMTHLSVKTLRRYHDGGLLVPAAIDSWNGYRYYAPEQIGPAQTIRRLRELDMPVREIAELMSDSDASRRQLLLTGHLERLELRLEETREAVRALRRLIDPGEDPPTVELREVGALAVAAISEVIDQTAVSNWYAAAMTELDAALSEAGRVPAGSPGALIDHEIFAADRGMLTVFVPLAGAPLNELPTVGRVVASTVPAARLAIAAHTGNHGDIDVTYGRLARWVLEQGLEIDGPVRETYVVGPRDTPDVGAWRTEIGWPVRDVG